MIVYNTRTWLGSIFHWRGTVLPHIWAPTLCIALYAAGVYILQLCVPLLQEKLDIEPSFVLLGKFVSFFLVFRTNGAYHRYWSSNDVLKGVQVASRELHQQFIVYIKGGRLAKSDKDRHEWEVLATRCKTDATRLILAFCVAFKLHSRMALDGYLKGEIEQDMWDQIRIDRVRLRGLLTKEEFHIVDTLLRIDQSPQASCWNGVTYNVSTEIKGRPCHIMLYFLFCLGRDAALFAKTWGWLERSLNLADVHHAILMRCFEAMDQNICTPLPLPYGHLCKMLMFTFLLAFPFCLNKMENGIIVCVITPVIIAAAMFGMESISMEIEDPFGDDANDFAVMRIITAIESSMFETMLCRNEPATQNFMWVRAPEDYQDCNTFLCLASEHRAVLEMNPACTAALYQPVAFPGRQVPSGSGSQAREIGCGASGPALWHYDLWSWKAPPGPGAASGPI